MSTLPNGIPAGRLLLIIGLGLATLAMAEEDKNSFLQLPESPIEGGRLFMDKGCVNCHAIQGLGGIGGPDLGKVRAAWSFLDIAGVMWNHQPKMAAEFERRKIVRPALSSEEMFQLIAFVYFLNYFGNPGDAARGELIFLRKECVQCHSVGSHGPGDGIPLDRFQSHRSPASIAAALWNASKKMAAALEKKGVPRPVFDTDDIVDILAFIRREARPLDQERPVFLHLGNSRKGAQLFREKGCIRCHSVQGEGGEAGPALGSWEATGVLSQLTGAIWNHGPEMWNSMHGADVEFPKFTEQEMSELMTYLYFASFVDPPGDPDRGAELFADKGCLACHWGGELGGGTIGQPISEMPMATAAEIIAAMWNHASEMEAAVREADIVWPQIKPGEMGDLVAFIRSRAKTPEGQQESASSK